MEIRQGYKQTEVGIIPEEWEVKKLGECFEVIMGQSPSSKSYNEEEEGLPLVQGNADIKNNKVCPRMYTSEITKESYPNDLIMTVRAPVGDVYISDIHSCIGRGICAIRNGNKYLYYYLFNYKDKWERLAQGSTFTAITVKEVKDLNIPTPPLKEQEKIAEILSYYDKAIEQQELLIEKEKEFKKGMMQKIFSQEIRFKDSNGDDYPEWEEKKLGEISEISAGGDINKENFSEKQNEDFIYPVYANALEKKGLYGYSNIYKISGESITVTARGNIGVANYRRGNYFPIVRLLVIKMNKIKYSLKYFTYYINTIKIIKEVTGVPQLTAPQLREYKVFFPNALEEQQKIANFLSNMDNKIELSENKLELLKNEKKGMMQKLLTGEVRVQI